MTRSVRRLVGRSVIIFLKGGKLHKSADTQSSLPSFRLWGLCSLSSASTLMCMTFRGVRWRTRGSACPGASVSRSSSRRSRRLKSSPALWCWARTGGPRPATRSLPSSALPRKKRPNSENICLCKCLFIYVFGIVTSLWSCRSISRLVGRSVINS